ncbi:MAG: 4Fe-4S binding protein, partial [Phycisphaerae bacterium]
MSRKVAKRKKHLRSTVRSSGISESSLPILDQSEVAPVARRSFAKWRALSLSLVYLVFAAHILHWKITGKTLAPLELNEVMYTLELGIITAGFLFMCALVFGTLIFGRFFCSWACHIMVLQDFCAWLLRKMRIRRKPIRSRLLLLVPPMTAFYMFIWPQVLRAWESRSLPGFHFRTDAEGWASFATTNFWRNLPSAPVIVLTFLVCGFFIVYLLGSRTFCTYVCPYGAIFALADRFAPGRIQVSDKCVQCGTCTASCSSGIRVHEEVKLHGMIVNSACMKDLDCVSACPQEALHYGFTVPSFFKSFKSGGRFGRLPYDFSLREEALMAVVFVFTLMTFRGLYSRFPFLLSLALGGIVAYLTIQTLRLVTRPDVLISTSLLKHKGALTRAGRGFAAFAVVLALFVGHSAFVRYHEYSGLRLAIALNHADDEVDRDALADSARVHLLAADRWGLIHNPRIDSGLADVDFRL